MELTVEIGEPVAVLKEALKIGFIERVRIE